MPLHLAIALFSSPLFANPVPLLVQVLLRALLHTELLCSTLLTATEGTSDLTEGHRQYKKDLPLLVHGMEATLAATPIYLNRNHNHSRT